MSFCLTSLGGMESTGKERHLFARRVLNGFWAGLLLWLSPFAVPVASAADKPERISVAYCADCVQFHFLDKDGKPVCENPCNEGHE